MESGVIESVQRVATKTWLTGGGTAVATGLTKTSEQIEWVFMGLTTGQWQTIGVVGGLLIGLTGLVLKAIVDVYFGWRRLKLEERALNPKVRP
jgi:hypothetical protein